MQQAQFETTLELLSHYAARIENKSLKESLRREIIWFIENAKDKDRQDWLKSAILFAFRAALIDPSRNPLNQPVWNALQRIGLNPQELLNALTVPIPFVNGKYDAQSVPFYARTIDEVRALDVYRASGRNWWWDDPKDPSIYTKRQEIKDRLEMLLRGGLIDYVKRQIAARYGDTVEVASIVILGSYLYGPI